MPSSLAQRIAVARRYARLSQQGLADRIGVSRPAVSQWESENEETRTYPEQRRLQAISEATGVPLWWIVDDSVELGPEAPNSQPWEVQEASRLGGSRMHYNPDNPYDQGLRPRLRGEVKEGSQQSPPTPPPAQVSQPVELDDDKLTRSIQFLERQFALWDREFIASQHADLITGVYRRIGRRGESNLVELSHWLAQQIEGDTDAGPGGIHSTG